MTLPSLVRWLGLGRRQRRAQTLPGKRSNGGRGPLQLVLRQARSDLPGFLRNRQARFMTRLGIEVKLKLTLQSTNCPELRRSQATGLGTEVDRPVSLRVRPGVADWLRSWGRGIAKQVGATG